MGKVISSVEKGDAFEFDSYKRIIKAVENEEFGFSKKYARILQKAKYYSKKLEKEIVFDLAIEIWPPNATNYSNLYLIECKSYSTKKVPIGDLRKFASDVNDVAELNGKAIFITNSKYPDSALTYAKNTGMMIIQVNSDQSDSKLLWKRNKMEYEEDQVLKSLGVNVENSIENLFQSGFIIGLKKLSTKSLEKSAVKLLDEIDDKIKIGLSKLNLETLIHHLENTYGVEVDVEAQLEDGDLGKYDSKKNKILVDNSIFKTSRYGFVLAHEIGHLILHSNLRLNQESYNNFSDSSFNLYLGKHDLINPKHWIEWQANKFASYLLMPTEAFYNRLCSFQRSIGIAKYGHIFLDDQPVNIQDFEEIVNYLSEFFNTSRLSVQYKLEELELITYARKKDKFKEEARKMYRQLFNDF